MAHPFRHHPLWAALLTLLVPILALTLAGCGSSSPAVSTQQDAVQKSPAANFTLPDQDGQQVSLATLKGKVVLLDFIYTHCPPNEECPLMTAKFVGLQHSLKTAGLSDKVELLSITFDPKRDTPAVLKSYAKQMGADLSNWHFLSGSPEQIQAVTKDYGIDVEPQADGTFSHTAVMLVIDPQGMIRNWEPPDYPPASLLSDVRAALKQ